MPSTATTTWQDGIEGKLLTAVTTSTTTGITFKIKQINGATPTAPTAAFRLKVVQKTALNIKVEKWGVAAGTTQSGQTVTLGTVTRALSLTDGTTFAGSGTAQAFAAGADVFITWDNQDAALTAKTDLANTFTATNTFTSGLVMTATDKAFVPPTVTTSQRDAIASPTNGMIVYNSTTGVMNQYIGGAWTAFASGTTVEAANNVAGKVDIASATEIGAGTATDATSGALNVIPVSQTVKTSSGAGDENKLPVLGSAGILALGHMGTGTAAAAKYIDGAAGAWTTIASVAPITLKCVYSSGTSSTSLVNPTSITAFDTHTYTIPANDLVAGICYEIECGYTCNNGAGAFGMTPMLGAGTWTNYVQVASGAASGYFKALIMGTAAAGASVAVRTIMRMDSDVADSVPISRYLTSNFATNGTLVLAFGAIFGTSNGANSAVITLAKITKISSTAF